MRGIGLAAIVCAVVALLAPPAEAGRMYLAETYCFEGCWSVLSRARLDGTLPSHITEGGSGVLSGVALDPPRGQLFWSQYWGHDTGIVRGDVNGCDLVVSGGSPSDVQVDASGGKLYWREIDVGIERAELNGSARETIYPWPESGQLRSFALDAVNGMVYVVGRDYPSGVTTIYSINADGSGAAVVLEGEERIGAIAVDPLGGHLYWVERLPALIRSANVDGSAVEVVLPLDDEADAIGAEPEGGKLYWSTYWPYFVHRANLDGSYAETIMSSTSVAAFAFDPGNEVDIWRIPCSFEPVPATSSSGATVLVLLVLAASAWKLIRFHPPSA